jgi:diaminopimelate decarboxylase
MTTKKWEAPFIQPHRLGEINKFGLRGGRPECDTRFEGQCLEELSERYGSPLFVTSEERLRHNIRRLLEVFRAHCPEGPVIHGWSYKTNYTSAVCNILHQEGSWAEVVSAFEYEKARMLGVPGSRILFNGPNKSRKILERAVTEGAHIHLDHGDELQLVEAVAREQGVVAPVTLRISLNTGYTETWHRFGFNLENGQAHEAAQRILLSPHLRLQGLHSHLGTFILEPRAYGEQVRLLCEFMRKLEDEGFPLLESLDIGGGFPSQNALQGIYLPPSQAVPDLEEYARAVGEALQTGLAFRREHNLPCPALILESGRAVVDDAQVLVATVVGTKRLPDGRRAAILDAGINLLFTGFWYNHAVRPLRPCEGEPQETVLYGPLCMNIDVLRHSLQLPPLAVGDRLVFSNVGAYNNTQWMQFIEYRPNIVLIDLEGQTHLIRRGEDLDSMCAHDRLPGHLQFPFSLRGDR